jgi:hypothetical protein
MYHIYWRIKTLLIPHIKFSWNNIMNRQSHGAKYKESKEKGEKMLNK